VSDRVVALLGAGVKPVVVEWENAIGMRFALVPPGRFLMGSPPEEENRSEDEELHEVEITRPFWLGVFPVTQGQWRAVMGDNPSWFSASGRGKDKVQGLDTDDFPVEQVSWEDAQTFLKKLAEKAEEKKNGREYRLPSEAEWEYSCRGGADVKYPFSFNTPSTSLSSTQANFDGNYPYGGAAEGPYPERTSEVGSYEANPFGLFDMHGNVEEWCSDWFDDYEAGPATDPRGPSEGLARVRRGGSWLYFGRDCRAALRLRDTPSLRNRYLGFRVAAVPRD
jgi:formylglycine-generating enzyme required for sulfatase activity